MGARPLHRRFPLGKTGGLIEALAPSVDPLLALAGFRWVKPAASLKQKDQVALGLVDRLVSAG